MSFINIDSMRMGKVVFLATEIGKGTGGAMYDETFFGKLVGKYGQKVKSLVDSDFEGDFQNIRPNFLRFCKVYRKNLAEIFSGNVLVTNSRLYTRFLFFPWRKIRKDLPVFMIHHHFNFMTEHGIKMMVHKLCELRFLKRAKYIITPNQYTKDMCERFGFKDKVILLEAEELENKVSEDVSTEREKTFVFIGTLEPRKGVHYLIKSFYEFQKKNKEYKLVIVGSCKYVNYVNKIKKLIAKYRIDSMVRIAGRISDEEKDEILKNAYAFTFPSQNEGYGWVMIEAMRYGVPVIAFNNTAMPYTVNATNGRIVENKSVTKFSDAMIELVEDKALYKRLQEGAIETVKALPDCNTIEREYDAFFEVLKKCLE